MHPLIRAHLNIQRITLSLQKQDLISLHRSQLAKAYSYNTELINELVASCHSPKILVGFWSAENMGTTFVGYWDNTSLFTGNDI